MADAVTKLLQPYEAAQLLNISPRRLLDRAWRARVGLPVLRLGGSLRFDEAELRQWLESRREQPTDAA